MPRQRAELEPIVPSGPVDRAPRWRGTLNLLRVLVASVVLLVFGVVGYVIGSSEEGDGQALPAVAEKDGSHARVVQACPNSKHTFQSPALLNESGDGLPESGEATYERAVRGEDAIRARHGAVASQIIKVDGRAWRRTPTGEVEIIPEPIFMIRITVKSAADCPGGPLFEDVPVAVEYQTAE